MKPGADLKLGMPVPEPATRQPAEHRFPRPELHAVLDLMVAGVFDVEFDLLRLPTRGRARVALARQVAMYLAHIACGLSLTEVGALFERDRTTVAHACEVIEQRRDDANFDAALELLEGIVRILIGPRC